MTSRAVPYIGRRAAQREAAERVAARRRAPRILPLAFFVVVVIAVFFVMIFLRIALDKTAFELETIQRQISVEESRQLDLRLELAELQDPLRIKNEATRLNLTYPDKRVAVVVDDLVEGSTELAVPFVERPTQALEDPTP